MSSDPAWTPDRRTVLWWMGAASENQIVEAFTEEVRRRGVGVRYDSDAYWQLAADVAVRLTREDMNTIPERLPARAAEARRWVEQNEAEVIREWKVASVAEALERLDFLNWNPDPETVRWWTSLATGDRIVESLEGEVKERGGHLEIGSDAYWHLVAEVAVEHLHFELYHTAKAWGTDTADPKWAEQQEQPPPL